MKYFAALFSLLLIFPYNHDPDTALIKIFAEAQHVDDMDESKMDAPFNSVLKELIHERNWPDAIRRCKSNPEEAAQWDIGAIFDSPRPKYTRFDPNKPDVQIKRIYTEDDDDESKMEWIVGGQDMSSSWGNREMIEQRNERRIKKGRWKKGYLPLHWTGMNRAPLPVIKAVYSAYPHAVSLPAIDGKLPLHFIIDYGVTVDTVLFMLRKYPESAIHQAKDGSTPLHVCTSKRIEDSVLDVLLESAYQDAIRIQNNNGQLPLHVAIASKNRVAVQKLLSLYPEAVTIPDANGALPLHLAVTNRDSEIIKLIMNANRAAVFVKDLNKMLPLHHASMQGPFCDVELLSSLLKENAAAASQQDINGMLPIHWLAMRGPQISTMRLLLEAFPNGATTRDTWGRTPVWIVNKRRKDEDRYDLIELMEAVTTTVRDHIQEEL